MTALRRRGQVFFLLLAALLMAAGIHRGELAPIIAKAVRVCMECIGLG